MAEKSGFFNALLQEGNYDRKYNANDYSDNLAVVISNGVLRSIADDLKVTASGMVVTVGVGRGWINGHYYYNDSPLTFTATSAPISGSRYDRIMLRLNTDIAQRTISLVYVEGEVSASPVKPAPTRSGTIYDLVLADIFVAANTDTLVVTDTRDDEELCGWVFGATGNGDVFKTLDNNFMEWFNEKKDTLASVTLFKRYIWSNVLSTARSAVAFDIPQYDADTCFIEVYVNGILDNGYTLSDNIITFDGTLIAGTLVTVNCYKSIDGTGIMEVADEITELQNQVAQLTSASKWVYKCTGLNDNISLSEIAEALYNGSYDADTVTEAAAAFLSGLGGNTYLSSMADDAQAKIEVVGRLGATTPYAGSGTAEARYKWFNLGLATGNNKKIVFDFAKCEKINISCDNNSRNIILYGQDMYVRNARITASSHGAGCYITMVIGASGSKHKFDNCEFTAIASQDAIIAQTGTFTNCKCITKGSSISRNFDVATFGYVRLNGGTYYAYGGSGTSPTVFYTPTGTTSALVMAFNINTPIVSQTGYIQKYLGVVNSGRVVINGIVNYSLEKAGTGLTVTNEIVMNKAD